jgi:hypothetical protein
LLFPLLLVLHLISSSVDYILPSLFFGKAKFIN